MQAMVILEQMLGTNTQAMGMESPNVLKVLGCPSLLQFPQTGVLGVPKHRIHRSPTGCAAEPAEDCDTGVRVHAVATSAADAAPGALPLHGSPLQGSHPHPCLRPCPPSNVTPKGFRTRGARFVGEVES